MSSATRVALVLHGSLDAKQCEECWWLSSFDSQLPPSREILGLFLLLCCMLADDPDVAVKQDHRKFLQERVIFREVSANISRWDSKSFDGDDSTCSDHLSSLFGLQAIPIQDQSIVSKIHQTYRLGYIKVQSLVPSSEHSVPPGSCP